MANAAPDSDFELVMFADQNEANKWPPRLSLNNTQRPAVNCDLGHCTRICIVKSESEKGFQCVWFGDRCSFVPFRHEAVRSTRLRLLAVCLPLSLSRRIEPLHVRHFENSRLALFSVFALWIQISDHTVRRSRSTNSRTNEGIAEIAKAAPAASSA
jgi:hypothetical protein